MTIPENVSSQHNLARFAGKDRLTAFAFLAVFASLGAAALWPIYQDVFFVVTVSVGTSIGFAIQFVTDRLRLPIGVAFLIILGALLVGAVPLTNPDAFTNLGQLPASWLESVQSFVLGWKQLVTIDIPVGTFQSLLAPVLLISVLSGFIFGRVVWGRSSQYWIAVIPMFVIVAIGVGFGGSAVARTLALGPLVIPIAPAFLFGTAALATAIVYLSWGGAVVRRGNRAEVSARDDAYRQGLFRRIRRVVSAAAVVVLAATAAGAAIGVTGAASVRDVLRTTIDPLTLIKKQVSPLSVYRHSFIDAESLDATVLTVESTNQLPDRIRLAVMPFFDGEAFRVAAEGTELDEESTFSRLPWSLAPRIAQTDVATLKLTYSPTDSPWLPAVDNLKMIEFTEDGSGDLAGALYVNRQTDAAVLVSQVDRPISYTVEWYVAAEQIPLEEVVPLGEPTIDALLIPASLEEWLLSQEVLVSNGAELSDVISKLRARGYLSHSLEEPTDPLTSNWLSELTGYAFQPSLSGHSIARVDDLFSELNARQDATSSREDSQLVAAVGDDEQFATAAALIAARLGFTARVVVGFRLAAQDGDEFVIPACDSGVCQGRNLTAWVEVAGQSGEWVAIDATPQYANPIAPKSSDRQDPKNPTTVFGDSANVAPAPQANPATGVTEETPSGFAFDLMGLLGAILTVVQWLFFVGLAMSPFVAIIWAKRARAINRKAADRLDDRLIGAWDEYVDLLVDYGKPIIRRSTRSELTSSYEDPNGAEMSNLGDQAAFADYFPDQLSVERGWLIVDETRTRMMAEANLFRRIRAALSLRSFVRELSPRDQIRLVAGALAFTSPQAQSERQSFSQTVGAFAMALPRISRKKPNSPTKQPVSRK